MKLLVGVDFSESTEKIISEVEIFAKALSAKVWLLHVADPEPDFVGYEQDPQASRDSLSRQFRTEHKKIQLLSESLIKQGIDTTALLVQGATVEKILFEAEKLNVDMLIIGSHGRGAVYQLLVGSVSEGVIHNSKYSVLVVPTHKRD